MNQAQLYPDHRLIRPQNQSLACLQFLPLTNHPTTATNGTTAKLRREIMAVSPMIEYEIQIKLLKAENERLKERIIELETAIKNFSEASGLSNHSEIPDG